MNIITKNFGVIRNHFNITKKSANIASALLVVTGTIAGGITLNPIILFHFRSRCSFTNICYSKKI